MNYRESIINSLKELETKSVNNREIKVRALRGPSKVTRISLKINEPIACFIAAIIGDGHLRKDKFQIVLDGFNKELIWAYQKLSNNLFERDFNIFTREENMKERYCLVMDSKAIYNVLKEVFEVPSGKKSHIVKVPSFIKTANKSIKCAFLIGIMTTEGGKRRRGFGLSTASKILRNDLTILFEDIGINAKIDEWINRKYNKSYYGLSFKKNQIQIMLNKCKNKSVRDIFLICDNLK